MEWETGLRLLLEQEATHHLVIQPDVDRVTPLQDALEFSDGACREPCREEPGYDCGCSTIVKLLLETDSLVTVVDLLGTRIAEPSPKAMMLLLEHLGQRRERLLNLALQHLSEGEQRDLGVLQSQLPDTNAPALWEKLQSLHQSGVVRVLHKGLDPQGGHEWASRAQKGIFHLLEHTIGMPKWRSISDSRV